MFRVKLKLPFMNNSYILLEMGITNNQVSQQEWKINKVKYVICVIAILKTNYLKQKSEKKYNFAGISK